LFGDNAMREGRDASMQTNKSITGATTPEGQSARIVFCRQVSGALQSAGRSLWAFGLAAENPEREALAIVVQIAGDLATGATDLYELKNWYAGAALVRQLVEAEYLMFLFAQDVNEAINWRKSTAKERKDFFTPGKMRQRSNDRFRSAEYSAHCDHGGHPTPLGRMFLPEHDSPMGSNEWLWAVLAQHLERLWLAFNAAISTTKNADVQIVSSLLKSFEVWRQTLIASDPNYGWFEFQPAP
jgi:hypothetical protein